MLKMSTGPDMDSLDSQYLWSQSKSSAAMAMTGWAGPGWILFHVGPLRQGCCPIYREAAGKKHLQTLSCKVVNFSEAIQYSCNYPRKHIWHFINTAEYLIFVSPSLLPKHTWKNNLQGSLLSEMATVIESINLMDQSLPSSSFRNLQMEVSPYKWSGPRSFCTELCLQLPALVFWGLSQTEPYKPADPTETHGRGTGAWQEGPLDAQVAMGNADYSLVLQPPSHWKQIQLPQDSGTLQLDWGDLVPCTQHPYCTHMLRIQSAASQQLTLEHITERRKTPCSNQAQPSVSQHRRQSFCTKKAHLMVGWQCSRRRPALHARLGKD